MQLFIKIIFLTAVLSITGCTQKQHQRWMEDGHAFPRPPADTFEFPPAVEQETIREEPIVTIISGAEVAGVEDARRQLMADARQRPADLTQNVSQLTLHEVPLAQVAALLTEMAQYNIAVTRAAAETEITIFLQNLPLRQAIEAICRLNGLWYREDDRIVTLMTTEEFFDEMVIRRNEKSRAFWLRYTNANDMAKVIQAAMGAQVRFIDIGSEEVYGHVQEDKEGGAGITVEEEAVLSRDEKEKLMALGLLRAERADVLELAGQIEKEVPAVITVFKRNNTILARSLDENILTEIGRIIEMMDTPTSQVLLEINILQLTLGDRFESFFQIDFPGSYRVDLPDAPGGGNIGRTIPFTALTAATLAASPSLAAQTLGVVFGNENIQAQLELFASKNRIETLASPFLMSANNALVEFFVGQEVPLRSDVTSEILYDQEGNPTTTIFDVEITRENIGTDITISSFINEDGTITMDLEAEISTVMLNMTEINVINERTGQLIPFPLDGVERSEITSVITAGSGQSLAIGGIIREQLEEREVKVPILGDLPLLGFFFKEIRDHKTKTETVIILTPHIISHPNLVWQTGHNFLNRRSSHPRFTRGQENILDHPTFDNQAAEEPVTEQPQPLEIE